MTDDDFLGLYDPPPPPKKRKKRKEKSCRRRRRRNQTLQHFGRKSKAADALEPNCRIERDLGVLVSVTSWMKAGGRTGVW